MDFSGGKPQVEARHAEDKEAGVFVPNLGRLPLLVLPDGATIGQSKPIGERGFLTSFGTRSLPTHPPRCTGDMHSWAVS